MGATEVGLATEILAILVCVVTGQVAIGVLTSRGHGQRPTFIADCIAHITGAASPGREAAVLVSELGPECLISTLTVTIRTDALVPASRIVPIVIAGVGPLNVRQIVPRVPGPHSPRQQHRDEEHRPQTHFVTFSLV